MNKDYQIITLPQLNPAEKESVIGQLKEIFYMSSDKKTFQSDEEKENFFKKWCGDYLEFFPQFVFLALRKDELLGYLTGTDNTLSAMSVLKVPGLKVFEDLYQEFPAHWRKSRPGRPQSRP